MKLLAPGVELIEPSSQDLPGLTFMPELSIPDPDPTVCHSQLLAEAIPKRIIIHEAARYTTDVAQNPASSTAKLSVLRSLSFAAFAARYVYQIPARVRIPGLVVELENIEYCQSSLTPFVLRFPSMIFAAWLDVSHHRPRSYTSLQHGRRGQSSKCSESMPRRTSQSEKVNLLIRIKSLIYSLLARSCTTDSALSCDSPALDALKLSLPSSSAYSCSTVARKAASTSCSDSQSVFGLPFIFITNSASSSSAAA